MTGNVHPNVADVHHAEGITFVEDDHARPTICVTPDRQLGGMVDPPKPMDVQRPQAGRRQREVVDRFGAGGWRILEDGRELPHDCTLSGWARIYRGDAVTRWPSIWLPEDRRLDTPTIKRNIGEEATRPYYSHPTSIPVTLSTMPTVYRYRLVLENWEGGPGASVLHSTTDPIDPSGSIGNFMNQIRNAWDGVKAHLLAGTTMRILPEVTEHDVASGRMVNFKAVTPPPVVTGTGVGGSIPRGTMATCRHLTDLTTAKGRRLNGRTFVGPLSQDALGTDGHIIPAAVAAFTAMWDGMQDVADVRLVILRRAKDADENGPAVVGEMGHVQASSCNSKPGNLRSRRD